MKEDGLLAAQSGEGGVARDLGDVEEGAGGEGRASALRVDREGQAHYGAVEGLVELETPYDACAATDGVYFFLSGGDDDVALRGAHRVAALCGDHTRLHAPLCDGCRYARPDALREIESTALSHCFRRTSRRSGRSRLLPRSSRRGAPTRSGSGIGYRRSPRCRS